MVMFGQSAPLRARACLLGRARRCGSVPDPRALYVPIPGDKRLKLLRRGRAVYCRLKNRKIGNGGWRAARAGETGVVRGRGRGRAASSRVVADLLAATHGVGLRR
jgi:hypothetical protein